MALYSVSGVLASLAARQVATKAWAILTGERPPVKGPPPARSKSERATVVR
jgi:hypothetical protein